MEDRFTVAARFVYGLEKGEYPGNLPSDPNRTKDGVTQTAFDRWLLLRELPPRDVYAMSDAERLSIYREYWDACHAANVPAPVDAIYFAHYFNGAPNTARRALQRALGVEDDGIFGAKTFLALRYADAKTLGLRLLAEQMAEYHHIALKSRLMRPNLTSWIGRLVAGKALLT